MRLRGSKINSYAPKLSLNAAKIVFLCIFLCSTVSCDMSVANNDINEGYCRLDKDKVKCVSVAEVQSNDAPVDQSTGVLWLRLPELGDFTHQVQYLLRHVRMTRSYVLQFQLLLEGLRWEIRKLWPDCKTTPFGSVITGLALKTSDIDVFVTLPDRNSSDSELVLQAAELLHKNTSFRQIRPIANVSVPLLRFRYSPTNQNCDVTFKQRDLAGDTPLIKYFVGLDNRALSLMVIIKYWVKINKLTKPHYMPNIMWYFIVIFYLQQVNILPSVHDLQKSIQPDLINNWNLAFDESHEYLYPSENDDNLYVLLGGFFQYYADFDFDKSCVSIFAGKPIARESFANIVDVPEVFELYKMNVRSNVSEPLNKGGLFCIQRSFVHNSNVGARVKPALASRVEAFLQNAANIFKTTSESDFLKAILTMASKKI